MSLGMTQVSPQRSYGIGIRCLSGYYAIILLVLFALAIARPDTGYYDIKIEPDNGFIEPPDNIFNNDESVNGSYTFTDPDGNLVIVKYEDGGDGLFRVVESDCTSGCRKYTWKGPKTNIWDKDSACTITNIHQQSLAVCKNQCQNDAACNAINYKSRSTTATDCQLVSCSGEPPVPTGQGSTAWIGWILVRDSEPVTTTPATTE